MAEGFLASIISPIGSWFDGGPEEYVLADPPSRPVTVGPDGSITNVTPPYTVGTTVYKQGEPSWLWTLLGLGVVAAVVWKAKW